MARLASIPTALLCLFVIIALVLTSCAAPETEPKSAHIAVASNFTAPMKELAKAFERETGYKLLLTFGSSGKFFVQIKQGAPFDVFLSADAEKPKRLEKEALTVPNARFTYATGTLVLWSAQTELVDSEGAVLKRVLKTTPPFKHLALANPRLAPYGMAAVATLKHLELYPLLQDSVVQGENIAQTYQFVASGNAELGFVALSQVIQTAQTGSLWIVPRDLYPAIRQDAVLLSRAKDNPVARAFLEYLKSPHALAIIKAYGYQNLQMPAKVDLEAQKNPLLSLRVETKRAF